MAKPQEDASAHKETHVLELGPTAITLDNGTVKSQMDLDQQGFSDEGGRDVQFVIRFLPDRRCLTECAVAHRTRRGRSAHLETMVRDSENWQANQLGARHATAARGRRPCAPPLGRADTSL